MSNKKLSFYQTQMKFTEKGGEPSLAITDITKTAPAIITVADQTMNAGDVIFITSNNPLVNGFYQILPKGAGKYELAETDFTRVGDIGGAKYIKGKTVAFCMATSLDVEPVTVSYSDVTTNCDDYPQEEGELEAGSISGSAYYNPKNPVHQLLRKYIYSQEPVYFQYKPRDSNVLTGQTVTVESFSKSGQTKEKWTADFGLKMMSRDAELELPA